MEHRDDRRTCTDNEDMVPGQQDPRMDRGTELPSMGRNDNNISDKFLIQIFTNPVVKGVSRMDEGLCHDRPPLGQEAIKKEDQTLSPLHSPVSVMVDDDVMREERITIEAPVQRQE